jgi:hypothetical protein
MLTIMVIDDCVSEMSQTNSITVEFHTEVTISTLLIHVGINANCRYSKTF